MKHLRSYVVTLVATTSVVMLVLLLTGWGSAVASQVSSVFVTNTDANGNVKVHEQGTANVQVTNLPATQPVSGTVNVGNPAETVVIARGRLTGIPVSGEWDIPRTDVSAYREVTLYLEIGSAFGGTGQDCRVYDNDENLQTGLGGLYLLEEFDTADKNDFNTTIDPAPPNIEFACTNGFPAVEAEIEWMLVGRTG
jgi:hypothetical protein